MAKKWFEAGEKEYKALIPLDVKVISDGTVRVWVREQPTGALDPEDPQFYRAHLTYRGVRQALCRGSSPLMAFGGEIICGQEFTREEVGAYLIVYGLNPKKVCVFEYLREVWDARGPARSLVVAAEEVLAKLEDQFAGQLFLSTSSVFPRPTGALGQLIARLQEIAEEKSPTWGVSEQLGSLARSFDYTVLAECELGIAPKALYLTVAQAHTGLYPVMIFYYHLEKGLLD